jgi:hypothetical protein
MWRELTEEAQQSMYEHTDPPGGGGLQPLPKPPKADIKKHDFVHIILDWSTKWDDCTQINSSSSSQIPPVLWNLKVHYHFSQFLAYNTLLHRTHHNMSPELDASWIKELHRSCLYAHNYIHHKWQHTDTSLSTDVSSYSTSAVIA